MSRLQRQQLAHGFRRSVPTYLKPQLLSTPSKGLDSLMNRLSRPLILFSSSTCSRGQTLSVSRIMDPVSETCWYGAHAPAPKNMSWARLTSQSIADNTLSWIFFFFFMEFNQADETANRLFDWSWKDVCWFRQDLYPRKQYWTFAFTWGWYHWKNSKFRWIIETRIWSYM